MEKKKEKTLTKEYVVPKEAMQKAYSTYLLRYFFPYFGGALTVLFIAGLQLASLLPEFQGVVVAVFSGVAAAYLYSGAGRNSRKLSPIEKVEPEQYRLTAHDGVLTFHYLTRPQVYHTINEYITNYSHPDREYSESAQVIVNNPVIKPCGDFYILYPEYGIIPKMFYVLPRTDFSTEEIELLRTLRD